jgi:Holliday junction resolvase RusA-like endonuclease
MFAIPRSKTGTLQTPVGDGDNYEKAIYDLLQKKKYLSDDRLITTAIWRKRFVPHGTPGYTEITLYEETEELEL